MRQRRIRREENNKKKSSAGQTCPSDRCAKHSSGHKILMVIRFTFEKYQEKGREKNPAKNGIWVILLSSYFTNLSSYLGFSPNLFIHSVFRGA